MSTYAEVNLLLSASDWTFLVCWAHLTTMIMITFIQHYSVFEMTHCACVACDSKSVTVAFSSAFWLSTKVVYVQRCLTATWLVPHETAAILVHSVYTITMSHHFMQSHICRVHACSAVTCHTYWPDVVVGCTQERHDELHLLQIRTSRHQGFVTQQLAKDASCWPVAPNTVLT